jgi:pyruvate/2-oxoglutarate dehydrogenase complex dihydrolipoamide acyltransferase (E2) component
MTFELRLTKINPNMTAGMVECCYVQPNSPIKMGDKLFDLRVDLSAGFSQYCPPISYFRVVAREAAVLKELSVKPGDTVNVGDLLAVFGDKAGSEAADQPARPLRVTTAGIAHHSGMWSARDQ